MWLSYGSLGCQTEAEGPGSDNLLLCVMTGRPFPIHGHLFPPSLVRGQAHWGGGPRGLPWALDMPAPMQRSLHTGERGVLPHLTHFIAVSWAWPVFAQFPCALIESSLHPIRQILFPHISQEKSEAQKSHVTSSNHTATMSELDFDLKTLAPKPPGSSWKTGASGFAAIEQCCSQVLLMVWGPDAHRHPPCPFLLLQVQVGSTGSFPQTWLPRAPCSNSLREAQGFLSSTFWPHLK